MKTTEKCVKFVLVFLLLTLNTEMSAGKSSGIFIADYAVGIYLFKVSNRNTRTVCGICSKLTIKTAERRLETPVQGVKFVVSIVDFEQLNADWVNISWYLALNIAHPINKKMFRVTHEVIKTTYSGLLTYIST